MNADPSKQPTVVISDPSLRRFDGGFTAFPNVVLRCSQISIGARTTYAMLLSYAWQKDFCFPAQERLASDLGTTDRTVRKWLTELRAFGLISWKQRGLNKPNIYAILKLPEIPVVGSESEGPEDISGPDWNSVEHGIRPGPANHSVQERNETSSKEDSTKNTQYTRVFSPKRESESSEVLVRLFHDLCGHSRNRNALRKELVQAESLLKDLGLDRAKFAVRFAVESAEKTNFEMQQFGAIHQYVDEALASFEKSQRRRKQVQAEHEEERRQAEEAARQQAEWLRRPLEERVEIGLRRWLEGMRALKREPSPAQVQRKREEVRQAETVQAA